MASESRYDEEIRKVQAERNKGLIKLGIAFIISAFVAQILMPLIFAGAVFYLMSMGSKIRAVKDGEEQV